MCIQSVEQRRDHAANSGKQQHTQLSPSGSSLSSDESANQIQFSPSSSVPKQTHCQDVLKITNRCTIVPSVQWMISGAEKDGEITSPLTLSRHFHTFSEPLHMSTMCGRCNFRDTRTHLKEFKDNCSGLVQPLLSSEKQWPAHSRWDPITDIYRGGKQKHCVGALHFHICDESDRLKKAGVKYLFRRLR